MSRLLALDALRAFVDRMPDQELAAIRHAAIEKLARQSMPTTSHEDWKYTDLEPLVDLSNQWLNSAESPPPVSEQPIAAITSHIAADWIVIRNGTVDLTALANKARAGLVVRKLGKSELALSDDVPLTNLNLALLSSGLSIRIDAENDPDSLIGLLILDSVDSAIGVSQSRIHIQVQPNAGANILEFHASHGAAAQYANSVIDIDVLPGARLNYVRVQNRALNHSHTARLAVSLDDGSQFHHAAFDFGGELIRNDLEISLRGRDALATACGLYLAGSGQHIDNHTRIDHLVGPARSRQEYRGILGGRSRCVWNGKAIVHKGADGSDAEQANHNLLVADDAEIDTKPELEIYADDVKCSHGTTVGQLDDNVLFYLRTRGIDLAAARHLVMRAFAQEIVTRSPLTDIEETISAMVASKLSALLGGEPR